MNARRLSDFGKGEILLGVLFCDVQNTKCLWQWAQDHLSFVHSRPNAFSRGHPQNLPSMQRENQIRRDRVPLLRPDLHLALPFPTTPGAMVSNMAHREAP